MKNFQILLLVFSISLCSCGNAAFNQEKNSEEELNQEPEKGLIALAKKGNKYGFIDVNNNTVIPFEYDNATNFSEGLACVSKGKVWQFIDVKNQVVIDRLKIEYPTRFKEGRARVHMGFDNMRFIDKSGKASSQKFSLLYEFNNGLARASSVGNKSFGYINKSGEWAIEYKTKLPTDFSDFSGSLASFKDFSDEFYDPYQPVNKMFLAGFIDTLGNTIIEPTYRNVRTFSEGLCAVSGRNLGDKWGYINEKGELEIELQYNDVRDFQNNAAAVRLGQEWAFIDREGKVLFKHKWIPSTFFSEELAFFWAEDESGKMGFIDKTGKFVIEPTFKKVYNFKNGYAIIEQNGKMGFINKAGKISIEPCYSRVDNFVNPNETNDFQQIN